MSLQAKGLFVQETPSKGRGVFTTEGIASGDIIELCPIILIPEKEVGLIHNTHLHDYYFLWGEEEKDAAIALGLGSLYNHSEHPNAYTLQDWDDNMIKVIALQSIDAFEEITISYTNNRPDIELWFQ